MRRNENVKLHGFGTIRANADFEILAIKKARPKPGFFEQKV